MAVNYSGKVDLMIDGGDVPGIPSTIIDLTDSSSPEILREGAGEL